MANVPRLGRENNRKRFVVGFAFNELATRVALIEKSRGPTESMVGTFNGIGGAVEIRETYVAAMRREFKQEAGPIVRHWQLFAIIEGADYRMCCYRAFLTRHEWRAVRTLGASLTDEMVLRCSAARLPAPCYPDVRWLVALALDRSPRAVVRIDRRGI